MHVPLVLAGGAVPSASIDELISGIDIAPTVATALGVDPADEWSGQPVGSTERDKVIATVASDPNQGDQIDPEWLHIAVRTDDQALLWWRNSTDTEYYQRTDEDESPVPDPDPDRYESALEVARSYRDFSFDSTEENSEMAVDKQRLKDLGYLN